MAEFTNETNSTAIKDGIATAGQPSEPIEGGICFWDTVGHALYMVSQEVLSGGIRCIPDLGTGIKDFSPGDSALSKAWTEREITNWLNGRMLPVTYDYTGTTYTLTISGHNWTGIDADRVQALAKAITSLLNDVNFSNYLA